MQKGCEGGAEGHGAANSETQNLEVGVLETTISDLRISETEVLEFMSEPYIFRKLLLEMARIVVLENREVRVPEAR